MSIQIYNTLSRVKEEFKPLVEGEVKMYVCGPTVYDFLHIGNYRGPIFFNLVRNWFEKSGFKVTYVYNYTDVDNRIINRANEEGVTAEQISTKYIKEFEKDYKALELKKHSHNPKVSEHMDYIIQFISELIKTGKAYESQGDVYFSVETFPEYGKLSNINIEELEQGHRIELGDKKIAAEDFALWKASKPDEPTWDSPWSKGRPGWHIECSAMIRKVLGDTIDIHGGGLDLVFPHHENEIAQSEGCTGHKFVRYWMHNNMLEFGSQKMSKSLGNVTTGRSFLEEYNPEILKYMMLSSHYRSVIDFSDEQMDKCIRALAKFYSSLRLAKIIMQEGLSLAAVPIKFEKLIADADNKVVQALDDDFNTPEAFAAFFEVTREFNKKVATPGKVTPEKAAISEVFYHWLRAKGVLFALFQQDALEFLVKLDDMLLAKMNIKRTDVDDLVDERRTARQNKDFTKSDEIRNKLTEMGIAVKDTAIASSWEVAK